MNIEELAGELSKLKYQVRTIGEAVDYQDHPLEALIIYPSHVNILVS